MNTSVTLYNKINGLSTTCTSVSEVSGSGSALPSLISAARMLSIYRQMPLRLQKTDELKKAVHRMDCFFSKPATPYFPGQSPAKYLRYSRA